MKTILTASALLLLALTATAQPLLPPMPPLPPGVKIYTNRDPSLAVSKPLPPVPDPRGRTVRDVESVLPKARWTEGVGGLGGKVVKHTFSHSKAGNTVTLSWKSEPGAIYEIDYAAGGHALFYPWPGKIAGWSGTNVTRFEAVMPSAHPGWWRVRRL